MRVPSLSVVIPVYNSERSLPPLIERLGYVLPTIADSFELVLVNDGSPDGSAEVMRTLAARCRWIRCIDLMRNYGQHNALLCGIREAIHPIIITMDDDLQNPPEEIPRLLTKLSEGNDVVYGYAAQESHGILRDLASQITKIVLQHTMGVQMASRVSSFRAFRSEVREGFRNYTSAFVSIDVLLSWSTNRFAAVPVENPPRTIGISNYTLGKLIVHALNMVTGFTALPLQVASLLGFGFGLLGLVLLAYVVGRYVLQGAAVPGFAFLASAISIFSGVQLFAIGIIGEYLARMHFRLMGRPSYTVRPEGGTDVERT